MTCTLLEVVPAGLLLSVPFGDAALPRAALVEAEGACDGGVAARVVSLPREYLGAIDAPALGARGCVPGDALRPPPGRFLVVTAAPPLAAGDVVTVSGGCGAWRVGDAPADLAALRPITERQLADVEIVRDVYTRRFGPLGRHEVPVADWGFVGLPLVPLDESALAAELARERLDTPARREKAVRWLGGGGAYAHFLGTDKPGSDVWATPATIAAVIALAADWAAACPAIAANPAACPLQIGDLAWFNPTRPDPLGHRDHFRGTCVDLRLFRTDASRYEAWWNRPDDRDGVAGGYDRALTTAFLRWLVARDGVTTVLFNDPAAREAVPAVAASPGHDDHIHVCFAP